MQRSVSEEMEFVMTAEENINRIMELQKSLNSSQYKYLNQYLNNAPRWVLEVMQVVHKDKNTVFIEENAAADNVYILTKGVVRAIDYRIQGVAYDYMWFHSVKVFGAMEMLFNLATYMTTLKTVTPCTMLVISRSNYERWIWEDKNALRMEMESIGSYMLEQNRKDRIFLFLQGMDRILFIFIKNYEQNNIEGDFILHMRRQELAEISGLSVKTVNRSIKKMEENGFIKRDGHKVIISAEQFNLMKDYIDSIVHRD